MTEAEETVVQDGPATAEAQDLNLQHQDQEPQESHEHQEQPPQVEEDSQERNWRQMRQRIEELQHETSYLREENRRFKQPAPSEVIEEAPDWVNLDNDDLLTKKQTLSAAEKIAAEAVKKALQEREYAESPKLIESEYSDYSQVVTPENVERLKQTNPRLAASLGSVKDPYAQGALAYSYIKSQGIYKGQSDPGTRQRAESNARKPMSVSAANPSNALESANAYANGLTPDLKKKLWEEMQAAIRG